KKHERFYGLRLGSQRYPVGVIQGSLVFDEVSRTGYALKGKVDIGSTNKFHIDDGRPHLDAVTIDSKRKTAVTSARRHGRKIHLSQYLSAGVGCRNCQRVWLRRCQGIQTEGVYHVCSGEVGHGHRLRLTAYPGIAAARNLVNNAASDRVKSSSTRCLVREED